MADTYTGSLNVKPTPELNPAVTNLYFELEGLADAYFVKDKVKRDNQVLTDIHPAFREDAGNLVIEGRNEGDETITIRVVVKIDGTTVLDKVTTPISPGGTFWEANYGPHPEWVTVGTHNIAWELYAQAGHSIGPDAKLYIDDNVNYTIPPPPCTCTDWVNRECTAVGKRRQTRTCTPAGCDIEERIIDDSGCKPFGDITKVELDSKLLPEGGTLDWIRTEEATIKVYFKNTGNVAAKFHIWVTDEDGTTLCDVTTSTEIPADGVERYVTCGSFTPTEVEKKTLTAHIEP